MLEYLSVAAIVLGVIAVVAVDQWCWRLYCRQSQRDDF